MSRKRFHINSLFDGLIRCLLTCLLNDYIGSIYCDGFTTTKQCYLISVLFASVILTVHIIFAVREFSAKETIEFSLFSILWCTIFKGIMLLLRLFVAINLFPQKETFYGEAWEQIIILGISYALFAFGVLMMWLLILLRSKLIKN